MDALPDMSWRRFQVLLGGLGPNSALVARLSARRPRRGKHGGYDDPVRVIDADANPEAFDQFWRSMVQKPKMNGRSA